MFDQKTIEQLQYYVYILIDSRNNKPFYVGKGFGNRVFNHLHCALEVETDNDKYNTIRSIIAAKFEVKHLIIRHGLTESQAFEIESTIIDLLDYLNFGITNKVLGHHAYESGIMTSDEIIRLHNAQPLTIISEPVIFFNINKKYKRGIDSAQIYEGVKEYWNIGKSNLNKIRFVLAEYRGLIVEVFVIDEWYQINAKNSSGKNLVKYGFRGRVAHDEVRSKYINKSVKKGFQREAYYKSELWSVEVKEIFETK
mgnify:CR=1 FL=1